MKKLLLIILLLPLISNAQSDVTKHYIAGNIISTGVGYATYKLTDKVGVSLIAGFVSGVVAGIVKEEIWDKRMGKGFHEHKDIYNTSWGSSVGTVMLVVLINENRIKKEKRINIVITEIASNAPVLCY